MTGLTGRRVLVTAGANGIGRAITEAFASAGAKVFVCDINEESLQRLEKHLPGVVTSACDISDRESAARMVADAATALGGLDVLVNNAGIAGPVASVADMDPDDWETVLRVNLTGTFTVTKHAIPHLRRSQAGAILIMSSLAGRFGYPNRSPYATTNWGLIGLTKNLVSGTRRIRNSGQCRLARCREGNSHAA